MLDLSDSVRASLESKKALGPEVQELRNFLDMALRDDERKNPTLEFDTIEYARLDKMLVALLSLKDSFRRSTLADDLSLSSRVDISKAKNLWRAWRRRFREHYIMIDQHRSETLLRTQLMGVYFHGSIAHESWKWQAEVYGPISELEGNLQFEPGQ